MNLPPCVVPGYPMNPCARALRDWECNGVGPLGGTHWSGWRLAGRDLVSPTGDRINARRLQGILWREALEQRVANARATQEALSKARESQPVRVMVVTLSEFRAQRYGAA